ncbi:MAG: NAD-dependent succinate-semialdehyde dehydrogenase [Methanothrix sp.]|nr:NAD-dependent succinate-semialdehyde dehydrogenase [Methanothrix sp.]OYV09095.1 MAG: succinate-semialdehyde dehydrogenase (NADP+) [Methanosaeta sp. NSP1]
MFQSQMLIDGRDLLPDEGRGRTAIIYNPANQEAVAQVAVGTRQDAQLALQAARRAFPLWSGTSSQKRAEILHEAAARVRERAEEIARLLTLEQGKPLKFARAEVLSSADVLDYYAEEGKRNYGQWMAGPHSRSIVLRQPIGVAALITPWNYPVDLLAWKVAPCLAAGCTFVAKPPSKAPLAATEFVRAVSQAGLPAGAANVVHGPGGEVGAELVDNPISGKIAFTGETATGRSIMAAAAAHIKRVSLELGGQSPFIVCADADIKAAAASAAQRAFSNMGQICISVNRIYVADEVAEAFTDELVRAAQRLKIGNGLDSDVDLGPMFSREQRDKTQEHVADALERGAELLCGGREPEGEAYERGYFFLPTVLCRADHKMKVMREETFGPVAPVMKFRGLEEALSLANDSPYGLAAYLFTSELKTALRMAEGLEAGGIGVNVNNVVDLQAPFGGWKESGLGRELGRWGLEAYMETKHIRLGM